jgi:hypothetical protein
LPSQRACFCRQEQAGRRTNHRCVPACCATRPF